MNSDYNQNNNDFAEEENNAFSAEDYKILSEYYPYFKILMTEKRPIKKAALAAGLSLLAVTAIILVLECFVTFVPLIFGISSNQIREFLSEPAIRQVYQIIFSTIAFILPFVLIYKISGFKISDLISFKKPEKNVILPLFLIGISFCSFANITTSYAGAIFESFGIDYNVDFGENPEGFFGFMLSLIATVITPALVEEFALRGIVLGSLRKFGDGFAIITSAALFGIVHGNFIQIPFAFLVGLVLGYITVKSGSVWIAVFVHAFNNSVSLVFDYFLNNFSGDVQNLVYNLFLIITLTLGLISVLLLKKNNEIYKISKSDMKCKEKEKYIWFFTSAPIIIFIVLSVLQSLAFFEL